MYCSNCGQQIPDGTRFCPACGAAQVRAPERQPRREFERPSAAPQARRSKWPWIVLSLLVLAAAVVVYSLIGRGKGEMAQLAEGALGSSQVTQAPEREVPSTMRQAPEHQFPSKFRATPEMSDYLKKLREIERKRLEKTDPDKVVMAGVKQSVNQVLDAFNAMVDDPAGFSEGAVDQAKDIREVTQQYLDDVEALQKEFNALVPPPEFRALHESYRKLLSDCAAAIKKVSDMVRNSLEGGRLEGLFGSGTTEDRQVEASIGAADRELGKVYDRYDIPDPPRFAIEDRSGAKETKPLTGF
jgi:hypothetical protein